VLVVVTVLLILTIVKTTQLPKTTVAGRVLGYAVLPVQKAFNYVGNQLNETYLFFHEIGEDKNEKQRLSLRVQALEDELRKLNNIEKENERLRQILNIKQEYKDFALEGATVTGRSAENWNSIIIINKGSNDGIKVNSGVISMNRGLVGRVTEVAPDWSKVLLITDMDSSVSCMVDRSRELGVIKGDLLGNKYGYLKMVYMLPEADISTDDVIVTSGFGGVLPKGILIGKVKEINQEKGELTKYSYIEPATDFKSLEEVLVIKSEK
jgi:rod shape-determining protein MreC